MRTSQSHLVCTWNVTSTGWRGFSWPTSGAASARRRSITNKSHSFQDELNRYELL